MGEDGPELAKSCSNADLRTDGVAIGGVDSPICYASPWSGMAAMYLLMGAFHLPAWLKLISGLRNSRSNDMPAGRTKAPLIPDR